jgi:translocation and assembly module TamB
VALRYPEGLRSSIDGDLRLSGDTQQQWLSGDVFVRQALWTRRYDITSELLSGAATATDRMSGEEAGLRCDLRLHIPGTLRVDNNLAALDARAELNLVGTLDSPVILGRADIDRGRLFFRGNTYVVRRGTIDFADPRRTDPFFDIEAETSMRGYRVVLSVAGTLARVHPRLTSDPPLSPLQILNLLAGADESSVTGLTQAKAQRDQAYLAATGAASLAAGRLSEEVGLEREAQRLFGLSRFSIDPRTVNPAYAEGGFATTARLSVAKRITPDVSVLYAQDLGGKEEYLLSLEFTLSDRVSLLLTRSERPGAVGEYGFDIFLRHVK